MLSALIEHSAVLGMTIIAMALLNHGLGLLVLRMQSRQRAPNYTARRLLARRAAGTANLDGCANGNTAFVS